MTLDSMRWPRTAVNRFIAVESRNERCIDSLDGDPCVGLNERVSCFVAAQVQSKHGKAKRGRSNAHAHAVVRVCDTWIREMGKIFAKRRLRRGDRATSTQVQDEQSDDDDESIVNA